MFRITRTRALGAISVAVASLFALTAGADTQTHLKRSMIVDAPASAVWAAIGPFCSISDWHPAVATCVSDGKPRPTRILKTRDGAKFVELQVGRDDAARRYAYSFTASPVPVSHYVATLSVQPNGRHGSIVTWRGDYIADPGQDAAAAKMLSGIYESGLAAIRDRFAPSHQAGN